MELRIFFRDKDLQKSSSRRSQVSDSQKTSEKYLEVSPLWNVSKSRKNGAWFFSKNSEGSARKSLGMKSFGLWKFPDWFENLIEEDLNFWIHVDLQIQCLKLF